MAEQRTDEWLAERIGKITASRVYALMEKTMKGMPTAGRASLIKELIVERLTGDRKEIFVNRAMQRGIELEPMARTEYEMRHGVMVIETGFVPHPDIDGIGASPDGLVGNDGLIEIKCPETWTHLEVIKSGEAPAQYIAQMQLQMACTGRAWCDFVSFDDRLPSKLAYFERRVMRDEAYIANMVAECQLALKEINEYINALEGKV